MLPAPLSLLYSHWGTTWILFLCYNSAALVQIHRFNTETVKSTLLWFCTLQCIYINYTGITMAMFIALKFSVGQQQKHLAYKTITQQQIFGRQQTSHGKPDKSPLSNNLLRKVTKTQQVIHNTLCNKLEYFFILHDYNFWSLSRTSSMSLSVCAAPANRTTFTSNTAGKPVKTQLPLVATFSQSVL